MDDLFENFQDHEFDVKPGPVIAMFDLIIADPATNCLVGMYIDDEVGDSSVPFCECKQSAKIGSMFLNSVEDNYPYRIDPENVCNNCIAALIECDYDNDEFNLFYDIDDIETDNDYFNVKRMLGKL